MPISCIEIVPTIQIRGLYLLLLYHVCEFGQLPQYSRSSYLHVLPEQHDKKRLAYCVRCWYMENIEPAFIWDVFHHHSHVLYVCVRRLRDVPFRQYVGVRTRCCIMVCLSTAPTRGLLVCVGESKWSSFRIGKDFRFPQRWLRRLPSSGCDAV